MSTIQAEPTGAAISPPTTQPPSGREPRRPGAEATTGRRRYAVEIPVDPEFLPYLGLMLVGLLLRFWDLGGKALHHDESLHAIYSWYLYQGRGYTHDPMMHGPLLFIGNALVYFLLGANDFTARLLPALFGVALIGMPWLLRNELGRWGAIAAAALFTISPDYLYFSRFIRHDIYVDVFTLLMVVGVFRYLATGQGRWFYTTVVGAALLFATKEDFYISGFIPFSFLVGCWFLLRGEQRALYRARVRALGWESWVMGIAIALAINVVLYTTFFTNLRGICTAFVSLPVDGCAGAKGALSYWLDQQDFRRGGQPWFYYLMLLPLYELLPLGLGVLSLFLARGRNLFFWYCAYWFVAALSIYSWAGEKMPWMLPQIALPLVLLAGRQLGQWAEAGWGRRAMTARGLAVGGLVLLAAFSLLSWVGLGAASVVAPIDQQSVTLQRLALAVLIAGIAGGLVMLAFRWGRAYVVPGVALGLLAVFGAAYLRTSILVNYEHPDTPVEPLVYVQSSPDVVWVAREIGRVANQTGQGKDLRILMDNGWGDGTHESVAWPFEWYLRDYRNRTYFTKTIDPSRNPADYPVLLVMATNVEPIQEQLTQYTGQKYNLNWWFPEDYKLFAGDGPGFDVLGKRVQLPTLRLDLIAQTLADPQNRLGLLKFLVYREAPNEMGAREFYFYVHNQVPQLGPAAPGRSSTGGVPGGAPLSTRPREAVAQTQPDGSVVFGRSAEGTSVLVDPKNVALGPDGKLYVVEGRAARVTVFNADGTIAQSWGSPGSGDGQFQEPWGVAVAPNGDVYVADTWNHRIQWFNSSGKFLGKWGKLGDAKGRVDGEPGVFWGPRSIAISSQGEVYVSDTGNKRLQVFDMQGNFRRMLGGEGSQPGQFREPVGLALDNEGNLLVADAWNQRVQRLDPSGRPLGEFPVSAGWESQSITNKPYLAFDSQGRIIVTLPDMGRVMVFGATGDTLSQFQLPQNGTPVGIQAGRDGRLYVADARNGVIVGYPLP